MSGGRVGLGIYADCQRYRLFLQLLNLVPKRAFEQADHEYSLLLKELSRIFSTIDLLTCPSPESQTRPINDSIAGYSCRGHKQES